MQFQFDERLCHEIVEHRQLIRTKERKKVFHKSGSTEICLIELQKNSLVRVDYSSKIEKVKQSPYNYSPYFSFSFSHLPLSLEWSTIRTTRSSFFRTYLEIDPSTRSIKNSYDVVAFLYTCGIGVHSYFWSSEGVQEQHQHTDYRTLNEGQVLAA